MVKWRDTWPRKIECKGNTGIEHSHGVNSSPMHIVPPPIVRNGRVQSSARGQAFSLLRKFFGERQELAWIKVWMASVCGAVGV